MYRPHSAEHDKSKVKVLGGLAPPKAALLGLGTGPSPDALMWLSLCAVSLQGHWAHWIRTDLEEHILPQPPL